MKETVTWDDVTELMRELRIMAEGMLRLENSAQSLTPTALVQTALRRQVPAGKGWREITWKDRGYFFGAVYKAMGRALIDHARARNAKKRQLLRPISMEDLRLHDIIWTAEEQPEQLEALLVALERLREAHPELAEIIEHRFFAGYTVREAALIMGRSEKTIRRRWDLARVLLHDEVLRIVNEGGIGDTL